MGRFFFGTECAEGQKDEAIEADCGPTDGARGDRGRPRRARRRCFLIPFALLTEFGAASRRRNGDDCPQIGCQLTTAVEPMPKSSTNVAGHD